VAEDPQFPEGPFLHEQAPGQLPPSNFFTPVGRQERERKDQLQKKIDQLERAIGLGQRMAVLKNAPGFQPFMQAVQDVLSHAQDEMVACMQGDSMLRILQGRCQAYRSILALMRRTEQNIQDLNEQLEAARRETSAVLDDGKVVPDSLLGGI